MKDVFKISGVILLLLIILLIHSCKKDKPTPPTIATTTVTEISYTTAISGGEVTYEGGTPVDSRGVCWNTSPYPTIVNNKTIESGTAGAFTSNISQLTPNKLYYVRAYATNSAGAGYGNQVSFTTRQIAVPVLTTTGVTSITQTTAVSGGTITNDNGGIVTERGVCWSTNQNPTIFDNKSEDDAGIGIFLSSITGLTLGTTYYIRAYATNIIGTTYGTQISFTTLLAGQFSDIDGNVYNTVIIGSQTWMKENLKTTKYANGDVIGTTTPATLDIGMESRPKYQWASGSNESNVATYGRIYTGYATVDYRKVCPINWHVPTDVEWTELTTNLGGESIAGGKLKETGTTHWQSPNTGATNETGFTALPGGYRFNGGIFDGIGLNGTWWSSTTINSSSAEIRQMAYNQTYARKVIYGWNMNTGFSVRCVKDN
jgi:uncharacterized protein (TIGR02145 family)